MHKLKVVGLFQQALDLLNRVRTFQKVFKNWFSVIQQVRKGNIQIYVKLKNGSNGVCDLNCVLRIVYIMKAFPNYFEPRRFHIQDGKIYYYNPNDSIDYPIEIVLFGIKYGVNFNKKEDPFSWYYDESKKVITTPDGIKFTVEGFDPLIFAETFLYDIHHVCTSLENKIVIHGGAYVGETALYYAKRGAKVYAFEPNDDCYRIALKNLSLNPDLAERIVLKNYALGMDGEVEFPSISCNGGGSIYKRNVPKAKRRSVSVSAILKEFEINKPTVLDIDIKGEEFKLINDPSISKFDIVRIEYTTEYEGQKLGDLSYLINKLKEYGFTKIRIYKHNELIYSLGHHGTVEAIK